MQALNFMKIHINQHSYSAEQILAISSFSDSYEDKTLEFCKNWLLGNQTFVIHTSGSTGTPKPISITRSQMEASAKMTAQKLQLFEGTKALICLNTAYIAGKMMLVRGMLHGWEMYVIEANNLPFNDLHVELDFAALVPTQLQQTLEQTCNLSGGSKPFDRCLALLNTMKAIIVGGAAISVYLENLIKTYLTVPIYSTYGMTETVSHIALKKMPSKDEPNKHTDNTNNYLENNYFSVMPNIEIDIDTHNCLKIKGLVTNQEWLQTNDLVELLRNETHNVLGFNLLGRVDNVVNSGGLKIQIEKVERQIEEIFTTWNNEKQFQKRFIVGGLADDFWGEKLVLLIEDNTWELQQIHDLQNLLYAKLAKYEIPKNIIFIDKFIETETAKINRKASLKMAEKLAK